jgi:hypothetical protein
MRHISNWFGPINQLHISYELWTYGEEPKTPCFLVFLNSFSFYQINNSTEDSISWEGSWLRNPQHFIKSEHLLLYSQEPAIGSYLQSHESNPHSLSLRSTINFFLPPLSLSRYSDWLRAGRPGGARVWVPVGSKICTSPYRLGSTQPPIKWVPGDISRG